MENRRIVMKDIAEAIGVHPSTVSLALRNSPRISKDTRDRINQYAESLGYIPDPHLASLIAYRKKNNSARKTDTIALVFDLREDVVFEESNHLPSILKGASEKAQTLGYNIDVLKRGIDFFDYNSLDRILKARSIRGIIFAAFRSNDIADFLDLDAYSMVKISPFPTNLAIDCTMPDCVTTVRNTMRKLKEYGYKRPAMAGAFDDEERMRNHYEAGFLYAQIKHYEKENHIPYYKFIRKSNDALQHEIYEWLKEVKPDVLISYWNNLAQTALNYTLHENVHCRFVSLEADEHTSQYGGMSNNYDIIAKTAVRVLTDKMKLHRTGISEFPMRMLVEPKWHDLTEWPPKSPSIYSSRLDWIDDQSKAIEIPFKPELVCQY